MRISVWSSDVCSSDLPGDLIGWDNSSRNNGADHIAVYLGDGMMAEAPGTGGKVQIVPVSKNPDFIRRVLPEASSVSGIGGVSQLGSTPRPEEHTSELQSLMRISYAAFCLKKKNNKHVHTTTTTQSTKHNTQR